MTCERVTMPRGGSTIICGLPCRKRCRCGKPATLACDWKTPTAKRPGKTCDAPICASCTTSPAPDKDLCPAHAEAWERRKAGK